MNKHYSFYPDTAYFRELIRPWKFFSFCAAMSWLFYGALNYNIGDWDVGVTIIMGVLTYLMAPWSVYIIWSAIRFRPKFWVLHIIAAFTAALFVVDWAYMLYHTIAGNPIYREDNFYASTPLYFLAGIVWLYRGSLKDLIANIQKPG